MSAQQTVDIFVVYEFLKRISTPYTEFEAFKLGLIDKDGKKLKAARTKDEKAAMNYFNRLILNLKRILSKVGLNSRMATLAAAMVLLKEHDSSEPLTEQQASDAFYKQYSDILHRKVIFEDAPTNSAGSGNVAGVIGDPPVYKRFRRNMLRRKKILKFQDIQRGRV